MEGEGVRDKSLPSRLNGIMLHKQTRVIEVFLKVNQKMHCYKFYTFHRDQNLESE